jgi:hypothetical protein
MLQFYGSVTSFQDSVIGLLMLREDKEKEGCALPEVHLRTIDIKGNMILIILIYWCS